MGVRFIRLSPPVYPAALFNVPLEGKVKLDIAQEYPLREAARAHQALESRMTRGSTLLLPE